jgi:hypothetical protein
MTRSLRLMLAVLTVWCLGCDAFEAIGESLAGPRAAAGASLAVADVATADAADDCHCVLGHAAVVSATDAADGPPVTVADFVDRPLGVPFPTPEPPLRPPVV